jgi:hypothetical protein
MGTSAFIFTSMLAVLWHSRQALVGVFWADQAGEPASVRRYHRTIAALVVLLVISLMGIGLWLSAQDRRIPMAPARLIVTIDRNHGHVLIRN